MTTIFSRVEQFLDSNDTDGAREQVAKISLNLSRVDTTIRNFAALLALGSQNALEIGLGVLGRKLLNHDTEINNDVIWLLLAAVLSRQNITPDSPSRISILGLISCVKDWKSPIFALLTPALDSFLKVSLSEGNLLIAEQTLDFIAMEEIYAEAPRTKAQFQNLKFLTQLVLDKVDDLELKDEWAKGLDAFFEKANKIKYSDENIWSAGGNLLKEIYKPKILKHGIGANYSKQVKDNIFKLITSSLAAIKTIIEGNNLSITVRIDSLEEIDNLKEKDSWSVNASAIYKLQRLFQEIADVIFPQMTKLPKLKPTQAIPGSWTIIFQMDITPYQSNLLAREIAYLSLGEDGENKSNSDVVDSWKECVAELKEDNLIVDLAVSTNISELNFVRAISTEDIPNLEDSRSPNIRILSRDVPQCGNLEKVIEFSSLLIKYPSSLSTVRQDFLESNEVDKRTFYYYRRSAEILGLTNEQNQPTNDCHMLNRLSTQSAQIRFLAYKFMSSNVGSAWFDWQDAKDLSEIQTERATEFLIAVCPSLSEESTAKRRAQTLQSWLKIFQANF